MDDTNKDGDTEALVSASDRSKVRHTLCQFMGENLSEDVACF